MGFQAMLLSTVWYFGAPIQFGPGAEVDEYDETSKLSAAVTASRW
jgi:hypothetical protein